MRQVNYYALSLEPKRAGLDIGHSPARLSFAGARGHGTCGWGERMQSLSESTDTDHSRRERIARYHREATLLRTIAGVTLDSQTRQELLEVARNYEILAMSIELLPPARPTTSLPT